MFEILVQVAATSQILVKATTILGSISEVLTDFENHAYICHPEMTINCGHETSPFSKRKFTQIKIRQRIPFDSYGSLNSSRLQDIVNDT